MRAGLISISSVPIAVARRSGRPVTLLGMVGDEERVKLDGAISDGCAILPQTSCRPTSISNTTAPSLSNHVCPSTYWRILMKLRLP